MSVLSIIQISLILTSLFISTLAQAHVTVEPKTAQPGQYAKLVFRVPHGCNGSETVKLTVQLPAGSISVKPQVHSGWKIKTKKSKLATPVQLHGTEVTEAISEITWSGGPLSDEYMDEFGVSLKLPDKPGEKLVFPVLQTCKKGSNNWAEAPEAGHEHHSKFPAPYLMMDSKSTENKNH